MLVDIALFALHTIIRTSVVSWEIANTTIITQLMVEETLHCSRAVSITYFMIIHFFINLFVRSPRMGQLSLVLK